MTTDMKKKVGIYIHVPFCLSKCHYCDFCSETRVNDEKKAKYVDAVCSEITSIAEKIKETGGSLPVADTVYFGGGTPTLLSTAQFSQMLDVVNRTFGICDHAEITAEANPKSADRQKLFSLHEAGVNRLSIGMQSVHDSELKALGRIHSFEDFKVTFFDARDAGFDNISSDLMYGIPQQTRESFAVSVETLMSFSPEHISSYCLTVEDGTNFGRRREKLVLPDEDIVSDMYEDMSRLLSDGRYNKYEISNFAKEGRESRHNLKYWRCHDYLGFGPAAHSCFENIRFAHSRDVDAYIMGNKIYEQVQHIGEQESMNEFVLLGMRLADGVCFDDFRERFGVEFIQKFENISKYSPEFVTIEKEKCHFTDKGMFVSNYILSDILEFSEIV